MPKTLLQDEFKKTSNTNDSKVIISLNAIAKRYTMGEESFLLLIN
jgi:hypothetical protein